MSGIPKRPERSASWNVEEDTSGPGILTSQDHGWDCEHKDALDLRYPRVSRFGFGFSLNEEALPVPMG